MDFQKEKQSRMHGIEMMILLIFSIYVFNMNLKLLRSGWSYAACIILFLILGAAWILNIKQYHTFEKRSLITTILILSGILLYVYQVQDFYSILPTFFVFSTIISFYGISSYIYWTTAAALLYYGSMVWGSYLYPERYLDSFVYLSQIVNMVGFEIVLFIWTKGRMDSERKVSLQMEKMHHALDRQYSLIETIGHFFQQPAQQIKQMGQDLEKDTNLQADILQKTLANQDGMCDFIIGRSLDLLDYAALQKDVLQILPDTYDVSKLMENCIETAMALQKVSGVEFVFDLVSDVPKYLVGDSEKIRRVLLQLIGNAFENTQDGFVGLTVDGRKESYGLNLMISIKDTGRGMSEEQLRGIMQNREACTNDAENKKNSGIGIGLYLVKNLVEKMGGTMMVQSSPLQGTEIKVVLPQQIAEKDSYAMVPKQPKVNGLIYINMERFRMIEIRDAYMETMNHILSLLPMKYTLCRNLSELKKRVERDDYSHIIITASAYHEDELYFDSLSRNNRMVVMMDLDEEEKIPNEQVYYVYKPFYIKSFVDVLWGLVQPNNGKRSSDKYIVGKEDNPEDVVVIGKMDEVRMTTDPSGTGVTAESRKETKLEATAESTNTSEKNQKETENPGHESVEDVEANQAIKIGDLDIQTATLYCGGESSFLMILTQFVLGAKETRDEILNLYQSQDWKNYIIKVHGLKSSALSLGAKQLSEQAKELEFAGKAEKYDLIHAKMEPLLAEYDRVIAMASEYPDIARTIAVQQQNRANETQTINSNDSKMKIRKEAIEEAKLMDEIGRFEEFSYELNEEGMQAILDTLAQYSYKGRDLEREFAKVKEKIQQADFFSAADYMKNCIEKINQKEGM